jgi:acetyl esterase/lipase
LEFVNSKSPATLILHGDQDPVVDISQSKSLDKALTSAGVSHELIVYKGQQHGWRGNLLSNSFDRIEKFLANNLD